jgi:uncharacterized protein
VIDRPAEIARLQTALHRNPVVLLVGPRQAGKSTLARSLAVDRQATYLDLEDPVASAPD